MSEREQVAGPDAVLQPMLEFWSHSMQQAFAAGAPGEAEGTEAAERWREQWLEAASRSLDAYMRTPAFLEAMKLNIDALIQLKNHADQLSREICAGGGDPTGGTRTLLVRLQELENALLARLDDLDRRLERLEENLGAVAPRREKRAAKKGK